MTLRIALGASAICVLLAAPAAAQDSAAAPKGPPTAIVLSGPEPGAKAPDFSAPWADKQGVGPMDDPFALKAHMGQVVVLAFYPRDFTSGCTAEMRTFADKYEAMFAGAVLVGVSTDSLETHVRFAESLGLPFKLLSDPRQRVAAKYGAKGSEGYNRRVVYVIGKDGKVAWREMQFGATDPKAYDRLQAAISAAKGTT
ncbi:MAG TPA: peroxiredoxin [Gemmatimonadales bacterium]|nr:peroxiredoxin [Gemmatimonadales bacterium]